MRRIRKFCFIYVIDMETIWYKDIKNLINEKTYDKFFPSASMTYTEKLNSIVRLSIYFAIILLVIKKDTNVLFVPLLAAIFTYMLYVGDIKKIKAGEDFLTTMNLQKDVHTSELCHKPTDNNPFMNILMSDYTQNPKRAKACDVSQAPVRKMTQKYFNHNLYRDVSDVFHKNASDRNYYTMPSTEIPNAQDKFLKFTYNIDQTCKEGNGRICYANSYRNIYG